VTRYRLTASRSPAGRGPRLFSGPPAPARARARAGAAHAAPRARPRSDPRARRARSAPAAPTTAATHATHPDPLRSRPTSCPSARTTRPPHDETQAGTACGTPAPLACPDSLPAGPNNPALSCPPTRGHSSDDRGDHDCTPVVVRTENPAHRLENPAEGWRRPEVRPGDTPAGRSRPSNEPIRAFASPREDMVPDAKASTPDGRSTPVCDQWLPREADVSTRSTLRSGTNHTSATAM